MAPSVTHQTLDFSSCRDLTIGEFEPHIRLCADSAEPAWDSRSSSLSAPPPRACALSLSQTLKKKKSKTFSFHGLECLRKFISYY